MSDTLAGMSCLQKKDIQQAALTLADVVQHETTWSAVWGDAIKAQRANAFETPIRNCLTFGHVYGPSEVLSDFAVWLLGEMAEKSFWQVLRSGALWPVMKFPRIKSIMKTQPTFRPLKLDRKAYYCGKYFIYLQIIGMATAFQCQGFDSKLLRALIESSEQAGISINLETETNDNVRLYEHCGYHVFKEVVLATGNLPMWETARKV